MAAMNYGIQRHPDGDALEQYSKGILPESEVGSVEEHLLLCEHCRQRLEETDSYHAAMRGAATELRSRERQRPAAQPAGWTWLRLVPVLAGLAALVVVIGWWSSSSDLAGPPFAISLEATRGAVDAALAPADTWLLVRLDLAGLPDSVAYRLEMVNVIGNVAWQGSATAHNAKVETKIPPAKPGTYFIRVYSSSGEVLREFGLKTR